jgi:hypothetical protein
VAFASLTIVALTVDRRFAAMMAQSDDNDGAVTLSRTGGPIATEADIGVAVVNAVAMTEQCGARLQLLTYALLQYARLNARKEGLEYLVDDFVMYFKGLSAPPGHQAHGSLWSLLSKDLYRGGGKARSHFAVSMALQAHPDKYESLVNPSGRLCFDVIDLTRKNAYKGMTMDERGVQWVKDSHEKLCDMVTEKEKVPAPIAFQIQEVNNEVKECCLALCACAMICFL